MTILRGWQELSAHNPAASAFLYRVDGENVERSLTRGELDARARAVAAELVARGLTGRRVLLLYVPGLEFIVALLGCFYAGAIAVPAYPPESGRLGRTLPRLQAIIGDCEPALVLTTGELLGMATFAFSLAPDLAAVPWVDSEDWSSREGAGGTLPSPRPEDVAFLQYTSGSTAVPKGVVVGHDNLLSQLEQMQRYRDWGDSVFVSWLPFYHDFGLILFILFPLWRGWPCVLMSPLDFMRRPACWLEAIHRYRADVSAGPPFALDMCARKVAPRELRGLDLSCLRIVSVGAEPIHRATLERFTELVRPCGLRPDALTSGYGLAETVLMATAAPFGEPFKSSAFDAGALRDGRVAEVAADAPGARVLVSSGVPLSGQRIEIVDPSSRRRCAPDRVGEIWMAGPGVARGYWNRPEESAATFGAQLEGSGEGPFLRTGDLGLIAGGELYVVGRIKDLVIIRGVNHHPQDIEQAAVASHPLLRPGGMAAFSVDDDGGERLVVVAEVQQRALPADEARSAVLRDIGDAVRRAVSGQHHLAVDTVALLEPGQVLKTSSGKTMRRATRSAFLAGTLAELARFTLSSAEEAAAASAEVPPSPPPRSERELTGWLTSWLAARLGASAEVLTPELPFLNLGLDSTQATTLSAELSVMLRRPLPATVLYDHPNVAALAHHLADAAASSCAVLLADGGVARPLILIPGIFGMLTAFSHLARLMAAHMPVWGLDLPVRRGLPTPENVTALAARYADDLLAIPDAAPYRIAGYCSGGMVAMEVGRQLLARGHAVDKLVLLDAPYLDGERVDLARLRVEIDPAGERNGQPALEQAVRRVVLHIVGKRWAFGEGEALVAQMIAGGMANITTFQGFEPRPPPIFPTLISARERVRFPLYEEDAAKNAEQWGRFLGSPIAEAQVPGNHQSMLEPPHVVEVARVVLAELERSGAPGAA